MAAIPVQDIELVCEEHLVVPFIHSRLAPLFPNRKHVNKILFNDAKWTFLARSHLMLVLVLLGTLSAKTSGLH